MTTNSEIQNFNKNNFSLWKLKMKDILRKDNYADVIEDKPLDITDQIWK